MFQLTDSKWTFPSSKEPFVDLLGMIASGEVEQVHIVYHANCNDGFGAAWASHRVLGDKAIYHSASYGDLPPSMGDSDAMYIFDFSYSLSVMQQLNEYYPGRVVLLDHHQTARDALEGQVPNVYFNMNHSGAVLAWKFWMPNENVPDLLRYVEDRDLWKWELDESREVSAALDLYHREWYTWDAVYMAGIEPLIKDGGLLLMARNTQVEKIVGLAALWEIGGQQIPVVNTSVLPSEVGEKLLELYPDFPFAGTYFEKREGEELVSIWSLRSRSGSDVDVSVIAKQQGGGGHKHAAGFMIRRS